MFKYSATARNLASPEEYRKHAKERRLIVLKEPTRRKNVLVKVVAFIGLSTRQNPAEGYYKTGLIDTSIHQETDQHIRRSIEQKSVEWVITGGEDRQT
jgi:hypothetical protein